MRRWMMIQDTCSYKTTLRLVMKTFIAYARAPSVWLFIIGNAVWGLACMTVTRAQFSEHDGLLIGAAKWIAGILAISLPTVVVTLREANKADHKCSFDRLVASIVVGVFVAVFLGFCLEVLLSLLGVRHFLGIPIERWS